MWETKTIPDSWTTRWILLKPKDPTKPYTPGNLRPLTLIESLRKVWERILLNRIHKVWDRFPALHASQHCGRKKGTTSPLLQLINLMENREEGQQPLHLISWDIRKAFDSVAKPLITAAWTRLGLPPEAAQWITALDSTGYSVLRSPYALDHWPRAGTRTAKQELAFTPTRGTGQGGTTSPDTWSGFFDPLAWTLSLNPDPDLHQPAGPQTLLNRALIYADDLLTASASLRHLQTQADIVTAFAAIFGIELAVNKLHGIHLDYRPQTAPRLPPPIIHLHQVADQPHPLPLQLHKPTDKPSKHFRYLGLHLDTNNSSSTQLNHLRNRVQRAC